MRSAIYERMVDRLQPLLSYDVSLNAAWVRNLKGHLPTLPSTIDHRASHTGSTCLVEALISIARIIATTITMRLNEKIAATAAFCFRSVWRLWRRDRSRVITRPSQSCPLLQASSLTSELTKEIAEYINGRSHIQTVIRTFRVRGSITRSCIH